MARPQKNTIEYFPHYISDGKKMYFIEHKYGNDGYAVWFKLLETLGSTEHHFIDLNNDSDIMFMSAKCKVQEAILLDIINDLVKLGELNKIAWGIKIIWSDKFILSIQDAYKRRNNKCMTFEGLCSHLPRLGIHLRGLRVNNDNNNTQTILYNNKEDNTIVDDTIIKDTIVKNKKRFSPPNEEELLTYFFEKTKNEQLARKEAEQFYNYYESNGWMVGKNKMKKWESAASGWITRMDNFKNKNNGNNRKNNSTHFTPITETTVNDWERFAESK